MPDQKPRWIVPICWILGSIIPDAAWAQDPAVPSVTATIELRIGELDGFFALGSVDALEVDSLGRVYVLESDENRVRVFESDGSFLKSIGREGSGPGEFMNPVGMTWSPEGHLWVIDPGNARVTAYDTAGYLFDRRLFSGFSLAPWPGRFDRSGSFYHYTSQSGAGEFEYVMVRYDAELNPMDTLVPPESPVPRQFFQNRTEQWGTVRAAVPFTPRLVWRLDSNGQYWWALTDNYEVFRGARSRVPVVSQQRNAAVVTPQERRDVIARLDRFTMVGGRVDASRIPRRKPLIRSFVLDDLDRVWVIPELSEGDAGRTVEVFSTDGRFIQRIILPVEISMVTTPVVRLDKLYALERDDLGVPYVVVLRFGQSNGW